MLSGSAGYRYFAGYPTAAVVSDFHLKITFGTCPTSGVAINSHRADVDEMYIPSAFRDCAKNVMCGSYIVVDGIAFVPFGFHRIRHGTLLSEMNDGVRPKIFKKRRYALVVAGNIEFAKTDLATSDFFPYFQPRRDRRNGSQ